MADMAARSEIEAMAQKMVEDSMVQARPFSTNPDAALFSTAGNMMLGAAKTDEVRFSVGGDNFIAQGFADGILYVKDGDWTNFHRISWPAPVAATPSTSSTTSTTTGTGTGVSVGEATSAGSASSGKTAEPAKPEHHGGLGGILGDIASKIEESLPGHHTDSKPS